MNLFWKNVIKKYYLTEYDLEDYVIDYNIEFINFKVSIRIIKYKNGECSFGLILYRKLGIYDYKLTRYTKLCLVNILKNLKEEIKLIKIKQTDIDLFLGTECSFYFYTRNEKCGFEDLNINLVRYELKNLIDDLNHLDNIIIKKKIKRIFTKG